MVRADEAEINTRGIQTKSSPNLGDVPQLQRQRLMESCSAQVEYILPVQQ